VLPTETLAERNKIYIRRETKYIYGGKQNILQAADGRWGSFGGEKAPGWTTCRVRIY
jgi:hypothetical protein